jgi:hypothetical protein
MMMKKTWDEWAKPSIESGKFIAEDGMLMTHYNVKQLMDNYVKTFRNMWWVRDSVINYTNITSYASIYFREKDGVETKDFLSFFKVINYGISYAIRKCIKEVGKKNLFHRFDSSLFSIRDGESPIMKDVEMTDMLWASKSGESNVISAIEDKHYNDFISNNYGKEYGTITKMWNDGYTTKEISNIIGRSEERIWSLVSSKRNNQKLLRRSVEFLQQNLQ